MANVPFANARRAGQLDLDTARVRFFALVAELLGLEDATFVRSSVREGDDGHAATSDEVWARGAVEIHVAKTLLESSHGIHGEEVTLSLAGEHAGRTARAYLSNDARSGASVAVHVAGVPIAASLADRFVR